MRRKQDHDLYKFFNDDDISVNSYFSEAHAGEPKGFNAVISFLADYWILVLLAGLPVGIGVLIARVVFDGY